MQYAENLPQKKKRCLSRYPDISAAVSIIVLYTAVHCRASLVQLNSSVILCRYEPFQHKGEHSCAVMVLRVSKEHDISNSELFFQSGVSQQPIKVVSLSRVWYLHPAAKCGTTKRCATICLDMIWKYRMRDGLNDSEFQECPKHYNRVGDALHQVRLHAGHSFC